LGPRTPLKFELDIPVSPELQGILDSFLDLLRGLKDGFVDTFNYDKRYILWCYKAPGRIMKIVGHIGEVFEEFFKTWDVFEFIDNCKELFLQGTVHYLPCYVLYNMFDHLISWLEVKTIDDLQDRFMQTFFSNAQLLINDVMEILGCVGSGDFYCVGEDFGQIVYVFLVH